MSGDNSLALRYARFAESDYKTALIVFKAREKGTANNVCYHCQQAVEKFLKAYVNEQNQEHPRTHDLTILLTKCRGIDPGFQDIVDICEALNDYVTTARYPDDYIEYDFEDAERAVESATVVREFVLPRLACRDMIDSD